MPIARNLEMEFKFASTACTDADRDLLMRHGVPEAEIDQLIRAARIRVQGDHYWPDISGGNAFITPILCQSALTPESVAPDIYARRGAIADLLAWHPARPDRWALRVGSAEWLGCIWPQYINPDPVPIRRSPLAWFRGGCTGLVLLSGDAASRYRLLTSCIGGIAAEDREHAVELRRILERPWPSPRVIAPAGREGRRAA